MCGIAGLLDMSVGTSNDRLYELCLSMTDRMFHRGPDDRGLWTDEKAGIALGQRRLAIIDLAPTGHQPMVSRDGRYVVTYNGEIYNHRSLRERLEAEGRTFRGHSDTQVITEGCTTWGFEGMLEQLNGMFAIALWDREERVLHLARDRMGEKPLYYGWFGNWVMFGSELKALLAHPHWRPRLDLLAANLYFNYNHVPGPRTIFEGVYKLPPGHCLTISSNFTKGLVEPTPYWSLHAVAQSGLDNPLPNDPNAALGELESLLSDSVRLRMESDVPLGALLSGGIDSSLIVALMQRFASAPVKTFSVGFNERGYDESKHARKVADYLGTEHLEFRVTPEDALAVVPELPRMYDEPFADSSQIPTHLIAKLAREHVTVALSGDAGDECFTGYHRYGWGETIWARFGWMPTVLRKGLASAFTVCSPAQFDALFKLAYMILPKALHYSTPGDRIHKLMRVISSPSQHALYDALLTNLSGHVSPGVTSARGYGGASKELQIDEFVPWMVALDMLVYLPDDILVKVDRATMAASLESRAPFLDHRLVEFSWRLPMELKLRGTVGKWITRELLYKHVPRAIVDRPKQGFSVPLDAWLRGPLRDWAEELLRPQGLQETGAVDVGHVERRWAEHLSGRRNWGHFLWSVLMFEEWRRTYLA